jgi:predicted GTPase
MHSANRSPSWYGGRVQAEGRSDRRDVRLSLISHTNVGKTTLARTLLRRDIGEVRDAAHVTEVAESHTLIETAQDEALVLWDTPGFGDSARLLHRLEQSGNPLGCTPTQVWIDTPTCL